MNMQRENTNSADTEFNDPLVSVCIPVYNHESYIKECIESVISQTHQNIELIIINDGSQDNSAEIINGLISVCQDRFVRFEFRNRSNKGLSATLNEAISWAQGEFFSAIASDDQMLPSKTSLLAAVLQNNPASVAAFGSCLRIDEDGKILPSTPSRRAVFCFEDIFLRNCNICTPAQMIRLTDLKSSGGYKEGLFIEDFYMWLKLTRTGSVITVIEDFVVAYRLHCNNSHKCTDKMHDSIIEIIEEYSQHLNYSKAKAISYLRFAGDFAPRSKLKALKLILLSVRCWPAILTLSYFYKNTIISFTPPSILSLILKTRNLGTAK